MIASRVNSLDKKSKPNRLREMKMILRLTLSLKTNLKSQCKESW